METTLKDIYSRITSQIIEAIEAGAPNYRMPWHTSGSACEPVNAITKRPYQGINVLSLWAAAQAKGYASGVWATYNQWQELGAQVRKGEKSALVVVWKEVSRQHDPEQSKDEQHEPTTKPQGRVLLARGFYVFNVAQVDGYQTNAQPPLAEDQRIEQVERFFEQQRATIQHGGARAFYRLSEDLICLPPFGIFRSPIGYYSTLAHEMTHWTGAPHRLNRQLENRFGSEAYAMEELIAELGAAFVCSKLGMENEPRTDHAAYIQDWLKVLKRDTRAIFLAASKSQQAVEFLFDPARVEGCKAAA